jgi:hypothetical protein
MLFMDEDVVSHPRLCARRVGVRGQDPTPHIFVDEITPNIDFI